MHGTKVARIERTAIGVRHQQKFRGGQHMIGAPEPWERSPHRIRLTGLARWKKRPVDCHTLIRHAHDIMI